MEQKKCTKCEKIKPLSEFYARLSSKDKKQSHCKECMNFYSRDYKDKNPDKAYYRKTSYSDKLFGIRGFTIKDIPKVWDLLKKLGYDTNKDIHTQFIDKVYIKHGVKLNKKPKPKDNFTKYFPEK